MKNIYSDSKYFYDVSVLIVNYNNIQLLEDCIQSILKNTVEIHFEIIVVDNNSTDGNVEELIKKYNNVKLILNKTNAGFAAANNQGLKIAKGKYILFLNNDTLLIENSLKKVFDYAESRLDQILIGCKLLNTDFSIQYSVYDFPSIGNILFSNLSLYRLFPKLKIFNKYHLMNKQISDITKVDVVIGAFMFCPTDAIVKLNGFDERFYFYNDDTDLCYRFKNSIGQVLYYPYTSIVHHGGATVNKNSWFKFKNQTLVQIQFYQKYFSGFKFLTAVLLNYLGILIRIPYFFILGTISLKISHILTSYYYLKSLFYYPPNKFNKNPEKRII